MAMPWIQSHLYAYDELGIWITMAVLPNLFLLVVDSKKNTRAANPYLGQPFLGLY
ncbi:MAG: hypothetical protein CM15mP83_3920 [Flavobacteriaceae bacterium]|nr:MAG: hypothetical protein CM15mP83_3920 [Flavobacteriaceae bacterium]